MPAMRFFVEPGTQHILYPGSHHKAPTSDIPLEERKQSISTVTVVDRNAFEATPIARPPHSISWFERFHSTWIPELLGLLCSAAALITIVTILFRYDGKQRPEWKISLNAVVSILSAIVTAGALYNVTHGVSQLKWAWVSEKDRKLVDIQAFDSGSRGGFGAIALLFHLRARHLAALGAAAIILCAGIDPFIQNVIKFQDGVRLDETRTSYAAKALMYETVGIPILFSASSTNFELKSCLYSAVHGNKQTKAMQPQHLCQTGNCTWDRFVTLAFCPKCVDVSQHLEHACEDDSVTSGCTVSFPGGSPVLSFNASLGGDFSGGQEDYATTIKAYSSIALNASGSIRNSRLGGPQIWHSIRANVSFDTLSRLDGKRKIGKDTAMTGTECAMYPCLLSIDAAVKNGQYQEVVVDTFYFPEDYYHKPNLEAMGETQDPQAYDAYKLIARPPWGQEKGVKSGETFGMTFGAYESAAQTIENFLVGNVSTVDRGAGLYFDTDEVQAVFSAKNTNQTCKTPQNNFACAFEAVGLAMSNTIREVSFPTNGSRTSDVAVGKVFVGATFVKVEWIWLLLPVTVWVLALIVWLGAIWKSKVSGVPLWKEDILPLIFTSPDIRNVAMQSKYRMLSADYAIRAEEVRVKLVKSGGQFDLVEQ